MAATLRSALLEELAELEKLDTGSLLEKRYQRLRGYGAYQAA